jgi:tRNA-dependent cyclodipeptide synthase
MIRKTARMLESGLQVVESPQAPPFQTYRATSYRAKIDAVSPEGKRATFEAENISCFLGVSLENSNFSSAKLAAILEWISRRFRHCTVLVGDSIHRITLESTKGLEGADSLERAYALGREFIEEREPVFRMFEDLTQFSFLTCGQVQAWPAYGAHHSDLLKLYHSDPSFRESVDRFGTQYHSKHSAHLSLEEVAHRIRRSAAYFLEEFAIFACLKQELGLGVMVYPGSFSTLSEIARGEHPAASPLLKELVVVSLHMRGRS